MRLLTLPPTCTEPTVVGVSAGTRAYMAPELVHMRDERLAYPWALDVYRQLTSCIKSASFYYV